MKKFELNRISLKNFKGVRELSVDLAHETQILGRNGSGKTTIFDAFTWCLFGKNSEDQTDKGRGAFGIKTYDADGNVISKLEHEVTIEGKLNGCDLVITRRLSEVWRRCGATVEYDGDKTTCIWNLAEIGVNEFNKRVEGEIIDQTQFKILTNPRYFSEQPWKSQLDILTRLMSVDVDVDEIVKSKQEWVEALSGKLPTTSIDEFRTTTATERKRLGDRLKQIPNIITGIKEATPDRPDMGALNAEKAELDGVMDSIKAKKGGVVEREREKHAEIRKIQDEVQAKRAKQQQVAFEANEKHKKDTFEANKEWDEANALVNKLTHDVAFISRKIDDIEHDLSVAKAKDEEKMAAFDERKAMLLDAWDAKDAEEFKSAGCVTCPLVNKPCDSESVKDEMKGREDTAREKFNAAKSKSLEGIESDCKSLKEEIEKYQKNHSTRVSVMCKDKESLVSDKENAEALLREASERLGKMSKVEFVPLNLASVPMYVDLQGEIEKLEADIASAVSADGGSQEETAELNRREDEVTKRLTEISILMNNEKIIADNEEKVAVYEDEMKRVAQQYADLEKREDAIKEIQRAIVDTIEGRINGKFKRVKFKTRDVLVNGESVETCYATMDGVRFNDLSDSQKVIAGLDIIDSLCMAYDIEVPIFIDRAESINQIPSMSSQVITLGVADCELSVSAKM